MLRSLLLSILLFWTAYANAQNFQPVEEGPIHEAFAQRITGVVALDAVPTAPPSPIQERIPQQNDPQTIWISGYWEWDAERQDFYWVTGTWRRPPPGRSWIPSIWLNSEEGWVRVHGFWSDQPENSLVFLDQAPPDDIDEAVANPPGQNYFWFEGYWVFNPSSNQYEWMEGQWQPLDPNWIMVPAHYVWRPQGYVFVAAYWDWLLDDRGDAYSPIDIPVGRREAVVYQPTIILEPVVLIPRLFVYYPDYSCIYYHHYHYHPDYWDNFWGTPPWWGWSTWWSYSWSDNWGLWWWYTHPGYPHPHWMTAAMSQQFAPPHKELLKKFHKTKGPNIITPKGVVKPGKLLDALKKDEDKGKKGKFKPIIPSNKKDKLKLEGQIEPSKEPKVLLPSGKQGEKNKAPIAKPNLDRDIINKVPKGGKVKEPTPPKITLPKKDGKLKDKNIPKDIKPPIRKPDQGKPVQDNDNKVPKDIKPPIKKPDQGKPAKDKDRGPKIINPNQPDKGDKNRNRGTIVIPPQPNIPDSKKPDKKIRDQNPKRDRGDGDGGKIIIPPQQPDRKDFPKERIRDYQPDDSDRTPKVKWGGDSQDRGGKWNRGGDGDGDRSFKMKSGGDSQERGGGGRQDRGDRKDKDKDRD